MWTRERRSRLFYTLYQGRLGYAENSRDECILTDNKDIMMGFITDLYDFIVVGCGIFGGDRRTRLGHLSDKVSD